MIVMRRAFTLIELLVVIAIIAILAAILFPVFAQARNAAKKTASISNVKQINLAAVMYHSDNDDVTVPRRYTYGAPVPPDNGTLFWSNLMQPYVKNDALFFCPNDRADDPFVQTMAGTARFNMASPYKMYILGLTPSYGMNYVYINDSLPVPGQPGRTYQVGKSMSSFDVTADTVFIAEATMKDITVPAVSGAPTLIKNPIGYHTILPPTMWTTSAYPNATGQGQLWGRFDAKYVIVGFLDGHVKYTSIGKLKPGGSTPELMDRYFNGIGN